METQSQPSHPEVPISQPAQQRPKPHRGRLIGAAALVLVLAAGAVAAWLSTAAPSAPAATPRDAGSARPLAESSSPTYRDVGIPLPAAYTVEPGDSLVAIAVEFDTSTDALRLANGLENLDLVKIGQVLAIPPAATLIEPVGRDLTLGDAARRYEISPAVLASYNGLDQARIDAPLGREELLVPDRSRLVPPPDIATPGADVDADATVYTVADGDTLLSIAAEFDVAPDAIMAANGIEDADLIVMGTELWIPVDN